MKINIRLIKTDTILATRNEDQQASKADSGVSLHSLEPSLWNSRIGRRVFLKRAGAATVGTAIALHGFRTELLASSSITEIDSDEIQVDFNETWKIWHEVTIDYYVDPDLESMSQPENHVDFGEWTTEVTSWNKYSGTPSCNFKFPGSVVYQGQTYEYLRPTINAQDTDHCIGSTSPDPGPPPAGHIRQQAGDQPLIGPIQMSQRLRVPVDVDTYQWNAQAIYRRPTGAAEGPPEPSGDWGNPRMYQQPPASPNRSREPDPSPGQTVGCVSALF